MQIEFVQGKESHSSYWGKFYVKGLEEYQVKEDFDENRNDQHYSYQGYVCLDIPIDTLFTIFEQDGNKRGTDTFCFSICKVCDVQNEIKAEYGSGFIKGNFEVIANGATKTKAPRLMDWWTNSSDKSLAFAEHCAKHINKRGLKVLPPMN